jgi:hypothetical protein
MMFNQKFQNQIFWDFLNFQIIFNFWFWFGNYFWKLFGKSKKPCLTKNFKIRYFGIFSISKSFSTFDFGLELLLKTFREMPKIWGLTKIQKSDILGFFRFANHF